MPGLFQYCISIVLALFYKFLGNHFICQLHPYQVNARRNGCDIDVHHIVTCCQVYILLSDYFSIHTQLPGY